MTTPQRPSLQRKQTRSSEKARKEELDLGIAVTVDDRQYTVRAGDLSSLDAMHLRRETGFSFRGLMMAATRDPDIDIIAAIVWLSRRIDGELLLSYEDVAGEITYDSEFDIVNPGEAGEPDPET